jgi:hypothetical protein
MGTPGKRILAVTTRIMGTLSAIETDEIRESAIGMRTM